MTDPLFDRRAAWAPDERPFEATGDGRPATRPNIVFIYADDLGWGDLGCYGSLHHQTPALDGLAADGVRLTEGYAASPTCSPTRLALLTGRYNGRLEAGLEEPLVTRGERHGIPAEHPTLPSLLRDAGYATAMYGKWHCGWLPWFHPRQAGYDEFFGNLDGAVDYFSHVDTRGQHDLYENETEVFEGGYYPDLITQRAVDYLARERSTDEPFFLHLNYTLPHWPWEGPEDRELSDRITAGMQAGTGWGLFHFDGGSLDKYREMVEALDAAVGRVLAALDEQGLREDTIVVFASDNGGERFAFLWPFVGEKGDLEEGGIRVPLIVRWPAALAGGQTTDVPVITMDLTATLLDAAGAQPSPEHPLDGGSLLPWLIDGATPPARDLLWRTRGQGALRRGRFKLLYDRAAKPLLGGFFGGDGPRARLFDVEADGREKADLAAEHPELLRELVDQWLAHDAELLPYPAPTRPPLLVSGRAD
jgi:arylsulfatase A-like enzyme